MKVPSTRKPNIEHGVKDQTNISLTLFNAILEITNTQADFERSWEAIEQDISIRECWEAMKRHPRNQS
jgi:hypothetical protein